MTAVQQGAEKPSEPVQCPRCGSVNVISPPLKTGSERWMTWEMLLLIFGISAPDPAYPHFRCQDCKNWWMKKGYG